MLASITPLGERGRGSVWAVTVVAFALGATAAGVCAGALGGALGAVVVPGSLAGGPRLALLAIGCAAACACDLVRESAPGPRRQVDERWLDRFRGWVYGLGFGAQLGAGVATRVTSAATYAAILAAALTGSAAAGAVVLGVYGFVRGVTPLAAARVRTPSDLVRLHTALARWAPLSRQTGVIALGAAALAAAVGGLA